MKRPGKDAIRRWLGYAAFSWVTGILFLYLTFPWEAVRQRVEQSLGELLSSPGVPVEVAVGEIRSWWIIGAVVRHVAVTERPDGQASGTTFVLPEIRARLEILPLLRARPTVEFSLPAGTGRIAGSVSGARKENSLQLDLQKVDLAKSKDFLGVLGLVMGADLTSVDLAGTLDGKVNLSLGPTDPTTVRGTLDLVAQQAVIEGGHVGELDLPKVSLGTIELKAHAGGGKLDFDRFVLRGGDVDLETESAGLVLNRNLGYSMPRGKVRLRLGQDLQRRIPYLGMGLSALHQPDREGYYAIPLGGTLRNPRFM